MKAIYKHEMASCFHTLSGYIFISFLLFFAGIFTYAYNLHGGYASFQNVLGGITFVFLVIVPILTMRSFAEEKHQKTDTLLYSLPVKMPQVVLGKFFALVTILAMALAVVALIPLLLSAYGNVNMASSYGALIGFLFLGGGAHIGRALHFLPYGQSGGFRRRLLPAASGKLFPFQPVPVRFFYLCSGAASEYGACDHDCPSFLDDDAKFLHLRPGRAGFGSGSSGALRHKQGLVFQYRSQHYEEAFSL